MKHQIIRVWPSNKLVDLLDPQVHNIDILDIANSLSMQNRFNGHTPKPYNVADHSVRVAQCVSINDKQLHISSLKQLCLTALLHDASEAYLGDIIAPLKIMLPDYIELENRWMEVISKRFNLIYPLPIEVINADRDILAVEENWRRGHYFVPRTQRSSFNKFMKIFEKNFFMK